MAVKFKEINLMVYRSVNGLKKELGKLSSLMEEDDNLTYGIDHLDTKTYISISKVIEAINYINHNSYFVGERIIKFIALMKIFRCIEEIPQEFLYKEVYRKRVREHPIEADSSWSDTELALIKFKKYTTFLGSTASYLFSSQPKEVIVDNLTFGFNSSGYIVIKNRNVINTDTADYYVSCYREESIKKIIITRADGFIPNYKCVSEGEDVVKATSYNAFETVDYHQL
jgi:hypothetical protein